MLSVPAHANAILLLVYLHVCLPHMCRCVTNTRVMLLCRVQWCARLWAASLLPFPKLPALTPRPYWPTPSPWLRTLNARKSYLICLIKRQSEQVREPQCQVNMREGTSDLSQNHRMNHRMVGVGRDLCGSSSPALLLKQCHLQ